MHAWGRSAGRVTMVGMMVAVAVTMACQSKGASSSDVVATFGDQTITQAELDAHVGNRLLAMKTQEFEQTEAELRSMIADRLMEAEAARRKISKEALKKSEIDDKIPALTDAVVRAQYEQLKPRLGNRPEEQALREVRQYLESQRRSQRESEFINQLMTDAGVVIKLDPPRAVVSVDDDPARGPANAPVTIVIFSDFQCPHCGRVEPTLKQLREKYGDKLRFVFRDYPLPFHAQAPKAAEAAQCAHEQGHFWEMHDQLFANQSRLGVEDLKEHARTVGLDGAKFDECLDSGRYASEWAKDKEDGEAYGVSGTPAFFINGRLLTGAQPFERFVEVIDGELARAGVPSTDTASK